MSQRVAFSRNVSNYDCRHGAVLSLEIASDLASLGDFRPEAKVLDVGAGIGRVTIAFGRYPVQARGTPALAMLKELRRKAPDSRIQAVVGEGAGLPFPTGNFDAVILARILYLMANWQTALRRALDVLKPGGCLFHEWGSGEADEAWVQIRGKARTLFEFVGAGARNPFRPGARSEANVDDFLLRLGRPAHASSGPDLALASRYANFLGSS